MPGIQLNLLPTVKDRSNFHNYTVYTTRFFMNNLAKLVCVCSSSPKNISAFSYQDYFFLKKTDNYTHEQLQTDEELCFIISPEYVKYILVDGKIDEVLAPTYINDTWRLINIISHFETVKYDENCTSASNPPPTFKMDTFSMRFADPITDLCNGTTIRWWVPIDTLMLGQSHAEYELTDVNKATRNWDSNKFFELCTMNTTIITGNLELTTPPMSATNKQAALSSRSSNNAMHITLALIVIYYELFVRIII